MAQKTYRILVINPGSTSTKIAVFADEQEVFAANVVHEAEALKAFSDVQDQLDYRKQTIVETLKNEGLDVGDIDIYVGRGGGLVAVESGAFIVTDCLLEDARKGMAGQHPAQLGSQICDALAKQYGGQAYIYNAPDVDEYDELSRVSGLRGVYRQCHIHTLNQKEIALRFAAEQGVDYGSINLIICHIGGGVSVTAHKQGRMIDGNDIIRGEGPMTPTRAGSLPTIDILDLCFKEGADKRAIKDRLTKNGGLIDHLGTADAQEVERMIADGNAYAKIVYDAMIYQIAKNVGACAVTLRGEVTAIICTGGMANSTYIVELLRSYIGWVAPLVIMPGEFEMEALAAGALRVARGMEEPRIYTGEPVWNGFKED
jgi:butyrate kinase